MQHTRIREPRDELPSSILLRHSCNIVEKGDTASAIPDSLLRSSLLQDPGHHFSPDQATSRRDEMQWTTLLMLALAAPSSAVVRFHCSQLVVQRLDPLVEPGSNPSGHVHQIVGGVRRMDSTLLSISNHSYRMPLMSPWTQKRICLANQHAQLASLVTTSRTIGLRCCISARRTVATSAFANWATTNSKLPMVA